MQNKDNYQIFIKSSRQWVPVTEEFFKSYMKSNDTFRRRMQRHGCCDCPKSKSWLCDTDCTNCEFRKAGDALSLDAEIETNEGTTTILDTIPDTDSGIEENLMFAELLTALSEELNNLDPEGKRICELIMEVKTEREIATEMGRRQSTINYKKNKVFDKLREVLKDLI